MICDQIAHFSLDFSARVVVYGSCSAGIDDATAAFERHADDQGRLGARGLGDAAVELILALWSSCGSGENSSVSLFARFDADGDGAWSQVDVHGEGGGWVIGGFRAVERAWTLCRD